MPTEDDPPRRRDDDYDDRPRRRDREDDYDDDRPRRRRRRDDDYDRSGDGAAAAAAAGVSVGVVIAIIAGVLLAGLLVIGLLVALLLPAVQKVREAAARAKDQNNLKQIALAMHNYHDTYRQFPPAEGNVSWRVHLLPFVEQEGLYRQFNLDQSWDSPSNKRLASQRIVTYLAAGDPPEEVQTHYRAFVGPHTIYEPGEKPLNMGEIKDGLGNTIMVVEATETVPWPQPKELQYDRAGPLPSLGLTGRSGFNVAMMDGSVRFVSDKTPADSIRGGIDPKDGRFFEP
jgi:hypothetical protein